MIEKTKIKKTEVQREPLNQVDVECNVVGNIFRALTESKAPLTPANVGELFQIVNHNDITDEFARDVMAALEKIYNSGLKASVDLVNKNLPIPAKDTARLEMLQWDTAIYDFEQVKSLCITLKELSAKRQILDLCHRVFAVKGETASKMARDLIDELMAVGRVETKKHLYLSEELLQEYIKYVRENVNTRVETTFAELDNLVDFRPGNLVILSARTGMGKTAFALQLMLNFARQLSPTSCLYFTMEVSAIDLFERLMVNYTGQPKNIIRNMILTANDDDGAILNTFGMIGGLRYCIYDKSGLGINEIEAEIRTLILQRAVKVIFIDYLGLINVNEARDRFNEIGLITRTLKALALKYNVVIFLLAQVNRDPEKRANKMPQLSDLRDSGSVEQDADVVLFIHRPFQIALKEWREKEAQATAQGKTPPQRPQFDETNEPLQIVVAKNRTGQLGTVNLTFKPLIQRYEGVSNVETIEFKE